MVCEEHHVSSFLDEEREMSNSQQPKREPLAVIGMGCRFPGGVNSPSEYWAALLSGVNAICDVPEDRWRHERYHDTSPEKTGYIRNARGGFIEGVDLFDADFFGHFPTEAQRMDPQQRLLLEVTHEAMEDAGIRRDQLEGSRTSVFVGSFMYDYLCMQFATELREEVSPYVSMGTAVSSLANRISYDFNLTGPSVTLDTACSASLVALHLACRSVWDNDADMAIAGGVNVMLRPESSIILSKGGFLNPDQYCKAFDASANGYVRGEGAGVVMLKPLGKAIDDGDQIYGCIRATASNSDGFLPEGFTVPNVFSQIGLLEKVYEDAGIDPLDVDYIEAHGTGTSVGDPIETLAIGAVLGRERDEDQRRLIIGSVKTNIGHLEGAAGIAGFIKAVLTAHHGVVPPNLHFNTPNPEIDWENLNLEVPTRITPLESSDRPRIVGVNSFGAGGTNAHAVIQQLEEAPSNHDTNGVRSSTNGSPRARVYTLRAAHRDSLRTLASRHAKFLRATPHDLDDIAYSLFSRRSYYDHQLTIVGDNAQDLIGRLEKFAAGEVDSESVTTNIKRTARPKLAFVFSGQGGQWARMGLQLMDREAVFRECVEEIDVLFEQISGWSLLAELRKEPDQSRINDTVVVQPTVMAIQIALLRLYEHYGIRPAGIVGHSIGEVAAGYAAGALTLQQAVEVIYRRSQAQNRVSGKGGMLAVGMTLEDAKELISSYEGVVWIGTVNGPEMLTLSGDNQPLEELAEHLESKGIFNRPVRVEVAYHSHHIDAIEDEMLETLDGVGGATTTTSLYSTVSGQREDGTHLNANYWFHNARDPVLFTDAMSAMLVDGFDTFIEIGPHPVLVNGGEALIRKLKSDAIMAPSMTRREPEVTVFLQSLAKLASRGLQPNTDKLFGSACKYVRVPTSTWQHQRYWYESPAARAARLGEYEHCFLKRQTPIVTEDGLAVWEAALSVQRYPYLRDHEVDGEIVFPATGHLELTWAVASEQFKHEPFFLENLQFSLPLIIQENSRYPLQVRLEIVSVEGEYRICSCYADDEDAENYWTRHSSGRINRSHDNFPASTISFKDVQDRLKDADEYSVEQFYEYLDVAGLTYGENFACIQELKSCGPEWLAKLELPDDLEHESHRHFIHPALLDACLHAVFADVHRLGNPDRIYLPQRIKRVRFHRRPTKVAWARVLVTRNDEHYLCSDTLLFDDTGEIVAEVLGLEAKRLVGAGSRQTDTVYDGCYEYRWTAVDRDPEIHGRNFDFTIAAILVSNDRNDEEEQVIAEVATRLDSEGVQPLVIPCGPEDTFEQILSDIHLDRRTLLVYAGGLNLSEKTWSELGNYTAIPTLLSLAQTLHKSESVPTLCVVTNGATHVDGDHQLDLGQSVLHGMSRVINNECPSVPVTMIDLSTEIGAEEIDSVVNELLHYRRDQDETEIAIRGQRRFVRQLFPVARDVAESGAATVEDGIGGAYRAEVDDPGVVEHVVFRQLPPRSRRDDDVEISVHAAGLCYRDISNAMGLLPENAVAGGLTAQQLGYEVAGRVTRIGSEVKHVRIGDDVMARVSGGFCGRVTASAVHVVKKPSSLTAEQAAGVPLVFVTAWYGLYHLARLTDGETVLIHSAAGGVGNAAIQLAKRAGATIVATAGTQEKRSYLKSLGIEHVFDSRSLDFSNQVLEATEGRGVDVVLNSLTGRFVIQNLKCIAPFGRYIELGKSDIYQNSKLPLERMGQNISWFAVDIDRLATQKPDLHRQALTEVAELFEQGELQPLDITEFPISKLHDAMKFMTRSAYHGKIVMCMRDDRVTALPPATAIFPSDRTYLISAGASGFGLEVGRWMTQRGARNLVLLSRSGCKRPEDQAIVDKLRECGATVLLALTDITNAVEVAKTIKQVAKDMPPLAGVIHGAAVMDDATLPNIDMSRFAKVFQPKAQGAWNLHQATVDAGIDLDFFVMMSSISSVLGFVGQVNYAASNYFEDALAHYRRQQGLPATSINLGVLGQFAGLSRAVNEDQDVIALLESYGMLAMRLSDILGKFEASLIQQPTQRMTAQVDWPWFRIAYPHLARDARFIEVIGDAALQQAFRPKGTGLRAELAALPPEDQQERMQQELRGKLAQILDAAPEKLDVESSIDNLALDSLMLTDLQVWINRLLDITLPLIKLLKGPSIASLSAELLADIDQAGDDHEVSTSRSSAKSFTLADMPDVEVLNPWLIRGAGDSEAPCRLICFHSMGVGASLFTNFLVNPPEDFDIIAVQTPGRENRMNDPVLKSVNELVDRVVPHLVPLFDRPVVIWGHSFGGVVAWEMIRRLREAHQLEPIHFLVTGTASPHLMHLWQRREVLLKALESDNSPEYLMSLSRYVDDPEFLKSILPVMRIDYPLLGSYRFEASSPLNCPITAFAARQDDFVYTDEIKEWAQHTDGGFELIEVDGDHWFLTRNRERIIARIEEVARTHAAQSDAVSSQPERVSN